ncbi:MAG: hypothetical protein ACE5HI_01890, partial [bacterium]
QAKNDLIKRLMQRIEVATQAADRLREAKKTINLIAQQIKERDDEAAKNLQQKGKAMQDSIKALIELINPREVQGIRRDPFIVSSRLNLAFSYLRSSLEAPGNKERLMVAQAEESLQEALVQINKFFEKDWLEYETAVKSAEVSFFENYEPLHIEE